jgi:ribose transport system permease protein
VRGFAGFLQRYGVLAAFVLLVAISAILQPDVFLKPENLRNLLSQNAPVGIVAVGMTLVIIAGGIDLSVGSLLALAAALGLWTLNKQAKPDHEGVAVLLAVVVTIGAGTVLGALNAFMIVSGRIAPFIATLVGLVGYRSLCLALADAGEIRATGDLYGKIGTGGIPLPFIETSPGKPLVLYWSIFLFILAALLGGFLLNWTRFGRYAMATGANEKAARYSAVPVGRTRAITYALLGAFAGLAGLLNASKMSSMSSSNLGQFYELDAIAAVVIGGTSLRGGSGRIWGTVVGVLLLAVIGNILVVARVSAYWQGAVKGGIILIAVLMQRGRD